MKYKKMFEKCYVGNMKLKNRVVMPPITTFLGVDNLPSDELVAYYGTRAKGGFGLVCIENACVTQDGLYGPCILKAFPESCISSWKKMFDEIHKYGSKVAVQLGDGVASGRGEVIGGFPHESSLEGIKKYKEEYLRGVDNMVKAGVDGIILYFTNTSLSSTSLLSRDDRINDSFGETMEIRLCISMDIIKDIRIKYGNSITLLARIGAFKDRDGRTVDETRVIAKALEESGVDAISFDSSFHFDMNYDIPPYKKPQGYNMDDIEKLKNELSVSIFAGGSVTEPLLADSYLRDGKVDLIEIGRGSIADPEWPNKAKSGENDKIHRCIGCCRCCEGMYKDKGCSVNPYAFRELKYEKLPVKSKKSKNVLIIGGGIAGLQVAVIAAKKGHKVKIAEKKFFLGGMAKVATTPINRERIVSILSSLEAEAKLNGVEIVLNREVGLKYVDCVKPDAIIVATGSKAIKCKDIRGYDAEKFIDAVDLLKGYGLDYLPVGAKFAIIGGGAIGVETAELLTMYENQADIYEMKHQLGMNFFDNITDNYMLKNAIKNGVNINLGYRVVAVEDKCIVYEINGDIRKSERYDFLVSAIGLKSENSIASILEDRGYSPIIVGDAKEPSRFKEVIEDAFIVGNSIE
ncbi:MAG: FAD-dependent oxidoreductase [Firmicutes bacterium]|nr:FAD-dependent oxidoreductase [Bacillota bacterium]